MVLMELPQTLLSVVLRELTSRSRVYPFALPMQTQNAPIAGEKNTAQDTYKNRVRVCSYECGVQPILLSVNAARRTEARIKGTSNLKCIECIIAAG
jgi:hypothetical protein